MIIKTTQICETTFRIDYEIDDNNVELVNKVKKLIKNNDINKLSEVLEEYNNENICYSTQYGDYYNFNMTDAEIID